MEVLAKYGNEAQKKQWLTPLLNGEIRSSYLMTEPDTASSDATTIEFAIEKQGDEFILNGSVSFLSPLAGRFPRSLTTYQKWWISGAGHDDCKLYIVFGITNPTNPDRLKKQSILLVPSDAPGITVTRMLSVYGYDDAPHGHAHILFKNVRVPASSVVLGEGRGFEVMQGRMGPGRIHHAMRSIGAVSSSFLFAQEML